MTMLYTASMPMTMQDASSFPIISLLVLGAVHGINPAMGWLFAVGRGLHERNRRAVWRALGPLALGHALAIGLAVLLATAFGQMLPLHGLRWLVGGSLLFLGVDSLRRHRHITFGGMNKSPRELAIWSFLVATAHGAGLMALPFMLGATVPMSAPHHHHAGVTLNVAGFVGPSSVSFVAPVIHTVGYLLVTTALAVIVYEKVGLRILRRAWINLHAIWAVALIAAGVVSLIA
jgi:hypothetical protein